MLRRLIVASTSGRRADVVNLDAARATGLETPARAPTETPYLRHGLAVTAVCLLTFGVPWCRENFGYIDPLAGNRGCAAAPSEDSVWAFHNRPRRPRDLVDLRKWIMKSRALVAGPGGEQPHSVLGTERWSRVSPARRAGRPVRRHPRGCSTLH